MGPGGGACDTSGKMKQLRCIFYRNCHQCLTVFSVTAAKNVGVISKMLSER